MINRISTDARGRWLVTASLDKTARVWEIASGRLLATLRPPQGDGNEGKLFAVALSPDGNTVAVGGWTGYDWDHNCSIYLFDRPSGQLLRRIAGLPRRITDLVFTRDGRWLAASLNGANGVRVFDVASGREAGRDSEYGTDSFSADFDRDGSRLVTTSFDGKLRLYEVESGRLRKLTESTVPGGEKPHRADFSPNGRYIVVGFYDTPAVSVVDAATLVQVYAPDVTGIDNGNVSSVVWSIDGQDLYAAGSWNARADFSVRRWSYGGQLGGYEDIPASRNSVMDLAPLPDGSLVFGASDPLWGVISARGTMLRQQKAAIADFRENAEGFLLSADGRQVRFAYEERGKETAVFDVAAAKLGSDQEGLAAPRTSGRGLTIKQWRDSTSPVLNGKALQLEEYERSLSVAASADDAHLALGADWSLRLFDRDGHQQWERPVPGAVWAVNISGDNRWVVAAYGDGTIRWHRIADGQEVLAFFPHADRQQWIAWTPEGFFDASKGAEALIGYHLNRGRDHEGEFITAKQVLDRYYRPALIARRLDPDGDRLVAAAVKDLGDVRELLAGAGGKTPLLELVSSPMAQTESEYVLTVRVKDQGGGVRRLIYRIDGVEVQGRFAGIPVGDTVSRSFPLPPGPHELSAAAINERGVESAPVKVMVSGKARAERPALHVLAVGVANYQDDGLHLKYGARDAEDLAQELKRRGESLFPRGVFTRVLPDNEGTARNIQAAFSELEKNFQPEDTFVLFLAGHGQTSEEGQYYFLPWDIEYDSEAALKRQGIDEDQLGNLMARMPAKSLTLLDTCRSGTAIRLASRGAEEKSAISRLARKSERAIITASSPEGMAIEGYNDHGVLTYTVLQALKSADFNKNGRIEVDEIALYVRSEVPRITEEKFHARQIPMRELNNATFPLATP